MAILSEYHAFNNVPGPRVAAQPWHRGNASAVRANREQWGETSRFSEGLFPDRYGSCRTSAGAETCLWRWHDQSFPPLPKRLSKVCGTCSPFQAESVRRSSRSDVCSARSVSLARHRSCRAERCERSDRVLPGVRGGVETSLRRRHTRSFLPPPKRLLHSGPSTPALRSKRPVFYGNCLLHLILVISSERSEPRNLSGHAGTDRSGLCSTETSPH